MKIRSLLLSGAILASSQAALGNQQSEHACPTIGPAPRTVYSSAEHYATSGKFSISPEGSVLYDYGTAYDGLGKWANPYFNSNYGHALYRDWLNSRCSDDDLKTKLVKVSDWFVSSAEWRGDMAVWPHPFRNDHFNLDAGWISGIGQARIAGVLYRAAAITGDDKYKRAADGAMQVYDHTLKEGGVLTHSGKETWIEEAPDIHGRSFKILNGHITAIAGLTDIHAITKNDKWLNLINSANLAVKNNINKFDTGFSTIYSLDWIKNDRNIAARGDYNALHVEQLIWMAEHFDDPDFLKWASHFQAYELNHDRYSASYSVNLKTNGPSKAKSLMGGAAWTTNTFPTTFEISLFPTGPVKGVAFDSLNETRIPIDFTVQAVYRGKIVKEKLVERNNKLFDNVMFDKSVIADKLRITFTKGIGNTALASLMPIRDDFILSPVSDSCNHRPAFSRGDAMAPGEDFIQPSFDVLKVMCDGWLLIPAKHNGKNTLKLSSANTPGIIRVVQSDDLKSWTTLRAISHDSYKFTKKFVRVEFEKSAKEIHFELM
ncbi:D-glucuronyl C5-epimerase family protein [Pseudomonas putida]